LNGDADLGGAAEVPRWAAEECARHPAATVRVRIRDAHGPGERAMRREARRTRRPRPPAVAAQRARRALEFRPGAPAAGIALHNEAALLLGRERLGTSFIVGEA